MTKTRTIFVVDDDADQAEVLATLIRADHPYRQVCAFHDPIRALAALTTWKPDLMIVDLSMPWISGEEVITTARLKLPELRFFLVSGYDVGREVAAKLDVGFWFKPVRPERVLADVKEVL